MKEMNLFDRPGKVNFLLLRKMALCFLILAARIDEKCVSNIFLQYWGLISVLLVPVIVLNVPHSHPFLWATN